MSVKIKIKGVRMEDFTNYKKPSMYIAFPSCTFKCEREYGQEMCQNSSLANSPNIEIGVDVLVNKYMENPITHAVVCAGLEPLDSWRDLMKFIAEFRHKTQDDIVVYTGYKEEEITEEIKVLKEFKNIIVKFGRYVPNQEKHYDEVLGVYLASSNQGAKKIS